MNRGEIEALLALPLAELLSRADAVRHNEAGDGIELCNIMNAKSGRCGEDCKFCAQSARHATGAAEYPLKSRAEMLQAARRAREIGAARFDIVTSGNRLTGDEIARIAEAVSEITSTVGIAMCASLGQLSEESLALLKRAGLSRYHHNIERRPPSTRASSPRTASRSGSRRSAPPSAPGSKSAAAASSAWARAGPTASRWRSC